MISVCNQLSTLLWCRLSDWFLSISSLIRLIFFSISSCLNTELKAYGMTQIMMIKPTKRIIRVGRIAFTSLNVIPMYHGSFTSTWTDPLLLLELIDLLPSPPLSPAADTFNPSRLRGASLSPIRGWVFKMTFWYPDDTEAPSLPLLQASDLVNSQLYTNFRINNNCDCHNRSLVEF